VPKLNGWIKALIVTSVVIAIVWRLPQLKRMVTGET